MKKGNLNDWIAIKCSLLILYFFTLKNIYLYFLVSSKITPSGKHTSAKTTAKNPLLVLPFGRQSPKIITAISIIMKAIFISPFLL